MYQAWLFLREPCRISFLFLFVACLQFLTFLSWTKIACSLQKKKKSAFEVSSGSSVGKESSYSAGDPSSLPGLGRSREEDNGNQLQETCLEKSHGQRSLVVYSQWGPKELDTTEQLNVHHPTLMWARADVSHQGSPDWARARQMGWVKGSVPDFWAKLWAGHRHLKKLNPSMHPREFISDQRF